MALTQGLGAHGAWSSLLGLVPWLLSCLGCPWCWGWCTLGNIFRGSPPSTQADRGGCCTSDKLSRQITQSQPHARVSKFDPGNGLGNVGREDIQNFLELYTKAVDVVHSLFVYGENDYISSAFKGPCRFSQKALAPWLDPSPSARSAWGSGSQSFSVFNKQIFNHPC